MKDRSKHWRTRVAVAVTLAAGALLALAPAALAADKWIWA
jgi:hypothetical protein